MLRGRKCGINPLVLFFTALVLVTLWCSRHLLHTTWTLISLPLSWKKGADTFFISTSEPDFDLTFAKYDKVQDTAGEGLANNIPPILHHIAFGDARTKWEKARQTCLDWHPNWEHMLWTEEKADKFVATTYPDIYDMWINYRYPIEKIDALRYLALYEYGGIYLDMDLQCERSLGPLRRFNFTAPVAHPVGLSNSFIVSSKRNMLVGQIVEKLREYNRHWFFLPYPTVMFSTGCHFVSTIHAMQPERSDYKILSGPKDNYKLHSINGRVTTPLFTHLGSSSWHSYDAALIVWLGHLKKSHIIVMAVIVAGTLLTWWKLGVWTRLRSLFRGRHHGYSALKNEMA